MLYRRCGMLQKDGGAVDVIRLTFVKKCAQMTGGGIRPRSEVGRWTAKS